MSPENLGPVRNVCAQVREAVCLERGSRAAAPPLLPRETPPLPPRAKESLKWLFYEIGFAKEEADLFPKCVFNKKKKSPRHSWRLEMSVLFGP